MRAHSMTTKSPFILVLALVTIAVGAAPASATFPGEDGLIAFDGAHPNEIFTAKPDGSELRRITSTGSSWSATPDWSPDGERIAFESGQASVGEHTYVMNADGSGETQLTSVGDFALAPSWSPDGDSLAIAGDWGHYPALEGIWIVPASDPDVITRQEARRVTTFPGPGAGREIDSFDLEPQFSPDGSSIVFTRYKAPSFGAIYHGYTASAIYRVRIDGSGLERLTPWRLDASDPDWSPDGQTIVFDSGLGYTDAVGPTTRTGNIHVMRADGSGRTRLTGGASKQRGVGFKGAGNAVWSPSGTRIIYTRFFSTKRFGDDPERTELVVMNADGSGKQVVIGGRFGNRHLPNRVDWGAHP